jgi:hypothetical protein
MIPLSPSGTPPKLGGELVTDAAQAECGLSQLVFWKGGTSPRYVLINYCFEVCFLFGGVGD